MKIKKATALTLMASLLALSISGCDMNPDGYAGGNESGIETTEPNEISDESSGDEDASQFYEKADMTDHSLWDDPAYYERYDTSGVLIMYLTVSSGNDADGSDHSWSEVNSYSAYDYETMGVDRYRVEGLLQIDETGNGIDQDSFGYGETIPNVSVQVRGQTSSRLSQKNYKISIKDGRGEFRGQRTIDLNKHYGDPYRFLNRLSYSLAEPIPQVIAGSTQFVHLYVRDLTAEEGTMIHGHEVPADESGFTDYGLYTMVEQVNRTYLRNHGFDENGQLYKVTFFEWDEYDAVMIPYDDPGFDRSAFEKYVEIKGDEDTTKLIDIIRDVNNYSIPIEEIVNEHFDEENIAYWMAFNILTGNLDVGARNLFLYSPLNSDRFYFLCWDMDMTFKVQWVKLVNRPDGESWEKGMTKFLGLVLIRRMMTEPRYRQMLIDAVEDVYTNYVNPDTVRNKVDELSQITRWYLYFNGADSNLVELETFDSMIANIPDEVDYQYNEFYESMKKPWPFFVNVPIKQEDDKLTLSWGVSYDYNGEDVTYKFVLATDPYFENVIDSADGLRVPMTTTGLLEPGIYYLRVVATNESGYSMECFDYSEFPNGGKVYGCYRFVVKADGTIDYYIDSTGTP